MPSYTSLASSSVITQVASQAASLNSFGARDRPNVVSVVLGGGEGKRLYPLTLTCSKPAINFAGKYRLVDIPVSNSIHAGFRTFVLTQFLASSLHHHLFQTYIQNGKFGTTLEILTAEQKPTQKSWYLGTADAVRQNIDYLLETQAEYFLILSGDQIYNMDLQQMVNFAIVSDVDAVVATLPVNVHDASRMGVLKINQQQHITEFHEKPQDAALLRSLRCAVRGPEKGDEGCYLASMGIYLFKRRALVDLLQKDPREDFGKHLIPTQVAHGKIAAFLHDGYWEDIGTIATFYAANMAMTSPTAPFNLYDKKRPIFSCRYEVPPTQITQTDIKAALLCEGGVIEADSINHSIIGPRSVIHKGAIIADSYLMGNDYYEMPTHDYHRLPPIPHIGEETIIRNAIIDKNVVIGKHVQLINKQKLSNYDGPVFIRDGIIIVPRGAVIPDGFIL